VFTVLEKLLENFSAWLKMSSWTQHNLTNSVRLCSYSPAHFKSMACPTPLKQDDSQVLIRAVCSFTPSTFPSTILCGLVVTAPGYRSRGPGLDSRNYQNFWRVLGVESGSLSLVRITEELLRRNNSGYGLQNGG
jgi:hypothetical protein